ncbi:MAG TPA: hypothetical protein VFI18_04335 [Gaiellales bacterium]|nr:hypothetical protein [Gaiellales bacterium]
MLHGYAIGLLPAAGRAEVVAAVDLTTGCGLVGFGGRIGYPAIHDR